MPENDWINSAMLLQEQGISPFVRSAGPATTLAPNTLSSAGVNNLLVPYQTTYKGDSLLNQYNNARLSQLQLDALRSNPYNIYGRVSDYDYATLSDEYGSQMTDAGINTGLSSLMGIGSIGNNMRNSTEVNSLDYLGGRAEDISRTGTRGYNSFGQIHNDWNQLGGYSVPEFDDVRGRSDKDKLMGTLSSGLAGFQMGNAIGGPVLGAVTGLAGAGAQIIADDIGDRNAENEIAHRRRQLSIGRATGSLNLNAANEGMTQYKFNKGVVNAARDGGKIMTVKEFADKVLGNSRNNDVSRSAGIRKEYCKGGLKISIKR